MDILVITPLLISLTIGILIINATSRVNFLINNSDTTGIQNIHYKKISRIGGSAIFFSFYSTFFFISGSSHDFLTLLVIAFPTFAIGLAEDLSAKISPFLRLLFIFISIFIAFFYAGIGVSSLGFASIDSLLNYKILSLLFTLLVVAGAVNSLNIIDGVNGLLSGYTMLALCAFFLVAHNSDDGLIMQLCVILGASVLGFFILNFPYGKIFSGDGGAYFLGLLLAVIGLTLANSHKDVSVWFVLLIFIYPMYEVLFSIYRRKVMHRTSVSQPDAEHLHSLVYKKLISYKRLKHNNVICSSMTSLFMWLLSLIGIVPAVIWHNNQSILIIFAFVFMVTYTIIYRYISNN